MAHGDAWGENIDCLAGFCALGQRINNQWVLDQRDAIFLPKDLVISCLLRACRNPSPPFICGVLSLDVSIHPPFRDLYKLPFHVFCLLTRCLLRVTRSQVQPFSPKPLLMLGKVLSRDQRPYQITRGLTSVHRQSSGKSNHTKSSQLCYIWQFE